MSILVVSKNQVERRLATNLLEQAGYQVHAVCGTLSGINALGARPYDFCVMIESHEDRYSMNLVCDKCDKYRVPYLSLEYGLGNAAVVRRLYNAVTDERGIFTKESGSRTRKCVSNLACIGTLVRSIRETFAAEEETPIHHAAC